MPIGEPALILALLLSGILGIWGLARVFNVGAKFTQLEQSHEQRANLLIALAAIEAKQLSNKRASQATQPQASDVEAGGT